MIASSRIARPPEPQCCWRSQPHGVAAAQAPAEPPQLQPTIHAAVPEIVDDYWFAPRPADESRGRAERALADAAAAYAAGNYPPR